MSRIIHLTVGEGGCCCAGATVARVTAPGDPGGNTVQAELEDPGGKTVLAELEDPGGETVQAELEDPIGGGGAPISGAHRPCGCGAPVVIHGAVPTPQETRSLQPSLLDRERSGFIILRMIPGLSRQEDDQTLDDLANRHGLTDLQGFLAKARLSLKELGLEGALKSRPLIDLGSTIVVDDTQPEQLVEKILRLETEATGTSFPPRHSLVSYWRLDARVFGGEIEAWVEQLNQLGSVDLAYAEIAATDAATLAGTRDPYGAAQGYWSRAPIGAGVRQVAPLLKGVSVGRLMDVEQGWILNHVELKKKVGRPVAGTNRHGEHGYLGHHGTAVLGELLSAGSKDGTSILGNAEAESHYLGSGATHFPNTNGHVAQAIFSCLVESKRGSKRRPALGAGDVLLLEVQRGKLPTEVDEADLDAIRLASAHGITVIEAAGNGGADLDQFLDVQGSRRLNRGSAHFVDSGAVLVGAARPGRGHRRAGFSNHGSRVDCFAWGEAVTTCGYGDLRDDSLRESYTNSFNGTSSAAPTIAGVAVLLQAAYYDKTRVRLSPVRLRRLLADARTGTASVGRGTGGIGVMPDLERLLDRLCLLPMPYMRSFAGDQGTAGGKEDPVSSSPDIVLSAEGLEPKELAEGSRWENSEAAGTAIRLDSPPWIHLRARNRGLEVARELSIELYRAPSATLITPELWQKVGARSLAELPAGDRLSWIASLEPGKSDFPSDGYSAFLASLSAAGRPAPPLPPGPPYFDWRAFRHFQRHPAVAYRNVHRIAAAQAEKLPFWITGTPDQERLFDLEIIRRLPVRAEVKLFGSPWFLGRLHQRQPWIQMQKSGSVLTIPPECRLSFPRIHLEAGARHGVHLEVSANDLQTGDSLAIRQLWRGEEVGRVTWFFD